jgi:tetrahydromethanopterin S-methyltransferase subunit G
LKKVGKENGMMRGIVVVIILPMLFVKKKSNLI